VPQFDPYDALVPIFHSSKLPRRFQQIGSAIFIQLNGEPFLLTAAHVTDKIRIGELLVPTAEGFSPIEGYMAHIDLPPEIARSEDTVDIAYYRLTAQFAATLSHRFTALPQSRGELLQSAHEMTVCSASGYPANKTKQKGTTFSSEIFSFRGVIASPQVYEELGLSPTASIVIHFHKKRAIDPQTLKAFPTPSLRGISGGGLFAWPPGSEISDDWSLPRLVGIVHTFMEREGLIIGTTFLPILAAIGLGRMKRYGASNECNAEA
jgi:hypothetical protein